MSDKLKGIRKLIKKNNLDVLLVTNPQNRRYLSGFTGTGGVLLISVDKALLVTDFRYTEQAAAQADQFEVKLWKEDLYQNLAVIVREYGWEKIGFEAKNVVFSTYREMQDKLPGELVAVETSAEELRMVKDEKELELLSRAAELLDRAFGYLLEIIRPGMTEQELALELEIYLLKSGAEKRAFNYIVASGIRGAMPHGTASSKVMQDGELVTIDFGAVFDGYATDMTRTVSLGEPDEKQREVYDIVYRAQKNAAEAIRPGLKGFEIDTVARDIITEAGYGEQFGHGLGHGVGLETHEQPVLNPKSKTILKAGMVVTVEPGIYIPGWGGVRIEDMVVVTKEGMSVLTKSPRELTVIQTENREGRILQ
ncbi:MAG: Xaa-Pro peptidase family protein [Bacillota bacterium]|nr:Xaa-Pro peptidase family protein [Bacillota bacterium]